MLLSLSSSPLTCIKVIPGSVLAQVFLPSDCSKHSSMIIHAKHHKCSSHYQIFWTFHLIFYLVLMVVYNSLLLCQSILLFYQVHNEAVVELCAQSLQLFTILITVSCFFSHKFSLFSNFASFVSCR